MAQLEFADHRVQSIEGIGGQGLNLHMGYQWVMAAYVFLVGAQPALVQLLPRSEPRVHDVDRARGILDEALRELGDTHGVTHVEDEGLPRLTNGAGLDGQLDRLLDAHEEPGDLWMGDRDRVSRIDLRPEGIEYRAAAAEHIPEPHTEIRLGRAYGCVSGEPFADSLRVTQHVDRIGRLVGRDGDEPIDTAGHRGFEYIVSAVQVGLDCLTRVQLEQRYVLERRGVKDDLGLMAFEDLEDSLTLTQIRDDEIRAVHGCLAVDRELERVQG